MVKRKTSLTRVSAEALEKIEQLKNDSGKTSAQIIDDALNLDKDVPTVNFPNNFMDRVAKRLGMTPEQFREMDMLEGKDTQENLKYFHSLRREHRKEFMKEMQSNPKFITLDNTKPPNAVIDSAILAMWRVSIVARSTLIPVALRQDIIEYVYNRMNTPIGGTSWNQLHKAWSKSYGKYKGKFEVTIDNRIYALMRNGIIKPMGAEDLSFKTGEDGTTIHTDKYESNQKIVFSSWQATEEDPPDNIVTQIAMLDKAKKGVYVLTREVSKDEWTVIDGVLNIKPQRGILIPKII